MYWIVLFYVRERFGRNKCLYGVRINYYKENIKSDFLERV